MSMDYLDLGAVELPACPGRTWFEALKEGWHDQSMMRQHMEGLHELDLEQARHQPVMALAVNTRTGPMRISPGPVPGSVAITVREPHYDQPAPWLPAEQTRTMVLPQDATIELDPVVNGHAPAAD